MLGSSLVGRASCSRQLLEVFARRDLHHPRIMEGIPGQAKHCFFRMVSVAVHPLEN
jgi:hypothetical protein